jgi:hypothetical protein
MSKTAAGALLGTVGCMLIAGSVEMARCPQLVAFVPKPETVAMTPERQHELAAMLARESAEAKIALPQGFVAEPARAVMPEVNGATSVKPARLDARKSRAARISHAAASASQLAKADAAGDRVNAEPEKQWVVLAAWEEVRTVSHIPGTTSDYEANAVGEDGSAKEPSNSINVKAGQSSTAGQASSATQPEAGSRYTVTRLILRVVPANSNSIQPGMVRGGWFVIQL